MSEIKASDLLLKIAADVEQIKEIINLQSFQYTLILQRLSATPSLVPAKQESKVGTFEAIVEKKTVQEKPKISLKEKLQKAKHSMIVSILLRVKKKLATELEMYFPNSFNDVKDKEVYDKIKQRTILQLESIAKGIDNADKIEEIDAFLFSLHKPKSFNGKTSIEINKNENTIKKLH